MASVRSYVGGKNTHAIVSIVPKCLALAVFALMLASQAVSYGGPGTVLGSMFPSSAFGGYNAAPNHASSLTQNTTQIQGSPLAPGTVKYSNTWNNTAALSCSVGPKVSQPLSRTQNHWSASVQIPKQLFMFGGSTNYIQQNYTVYSNGTMSVRDGSGNHFSFNLVGVQALSGTLVTSFLSNSSYAVLNYVVSSATQQLSNVSIIFSSTTQFCKPSGLEIKIVGSENWGISNIGTISFVFGSKPSSVMNNTAWFNNAFPISAQNSTLPVSPVSLGFNWN